MLTSAPQYRACRIRRGRPTPWPAPRSPERPHLRGTPAPRRPSGQRHYDSGSAIRDRLAIRQGDAVEFELEADGRVVLVKVDGERPASRFMGLRGRAGTGLSTDQIMALTRGDV